MIEKGLIVKGLYRTKIEIIHDDFVMSPDELMNSYGRSLSYIPGESYLYPF